MRKKNGFLWQQIKVASANNAMEVLMHRLEFNLGMILLLGPPSPQKRCGWSAFKEEKGGD
jgi:hypothetical protein